MSRLVDLVLTALWVASRLPAFLAGLLTAATVDAFMQGWESWDDMLSAWDRARRG